MRNDLISIPARSARAGSAASTTGSASAIECVSGTLWVTQDGDPRDIVLAAGEAFDFDHRGDALISALDDARFLLLEPARRRRCTATGSAPSARSGERQRRRTSMPSSRSASASSREARPRMPRSSTSP